MIADTGAEQFVRISKRSQFAGLTSVEPPDAKVNERGDLNIYAEVISRDRVPAFIEWLRDMYLPKETV